MNNKNALDIFNTIINENIVYVYHGDFNYTVVNTLLTDIKKDLHKSSPDIRTAKKTYKVLVECLENIHKHSAKICIDCDDKDEGIFILQKKETGYVVSIGNSIMSDEVDYLKEHLDEINSLDEASLKKKYRETLMNAEVSEKGGAGMGMIDIAMKSGSLLDYKFDDHTENKKFFSLKVLVKA